MTTTTATPKKKRLSSAEFKKLTKAEKQAIAKQAIEEGQNAFNEAMATLTSEDVFLEALRTAALCHKYSFRNRLWVIAQRPNFQGPIAGYNAWRDKLGYQVRKGEVGAMIWARTEIKVKAKDPDDPENEEKTATGKIVRYKIVKVFTRDQVEPIEGKALNLDTPAPASIEGDTHKALIPVLKTYLVDKLDWKYIELDAKTARNCYGWCDSTAKEIAIRTDMAINAQVRTLIHELIHALGISYVEYGRELAETITESACYLVCRAVGLDVETTSVPYVASWSRDDLDAVKREVNLIGQLADRLLKESGLDNHLAISDGEAVLLTN